MTPRTPQSIKAGTVGKQNQPLGKVEASSGFGAHPFKSTACAILGKMGTMGKVFSTFYMCAHDGVRGDTTFPFLMRRSNLPSPSSPPSPKGLQVTETEGKNLGRLAEITFPKTAPTFPTFPAFDPTFQQVVSDRVETTIS